MDFAFHNQKNMPSSAELSQMADAIRLQEQCDRIRRKFTPHLNLYTPSQPSVYKHFQDLPETHKAPVFKVLDFMEHLIDYSVTEKMDPIQDQQLTWYAMKCLNLRGPSDLFSMIDKDDCVEIYTTEGVQLYRNFHFFKYCSYSLEELMTYPFFELYSRPEWLQSEMLKAVELCFQTPEQVTPCKVPSHPCYETKSQRAYAGTVSFKKICALKQTAAYSAFLVTSHLSLNA